MKYISDEKLSIITPFVYAVIKDACISGSPTPSYSTMMANCFVNGKRMSSRVLPAAIKKLEDDGLIERLGTIRDRRYRLPTGEETTMHIHVPQDKNVQGPSLEDRAKMWGVPVKLSHPSDRHLVFDRRLMPPPGSLAGISYTVI